MKKNRVNEIMIESGFAKYARSAVAGVAVSIITAVVISNIRK